MPRTQLRIPTVEMVHSWMEAAKQRRKSHRVGHVRSSSGRVAGRRRELAVSRFMGRGKNTEPRRAQPDRRRAQVFEPEKGAGAGKAKVDGHSKPNSMHDDEARCRIIRQNKAIRRRDDSTLITRKQVVHYTEDTRRHRKKGCRTELTKRGVRLNT